MFIFAVLCEWCRVGEWCKEGFGCLALSLCESTKKRSASPWLNAESVTATDQRKLFISLVQGMHRAGQGTGQGSGQGRAIIEQGRH